MSQYPKSMGHLDVGVLLELLEAAEAAEAKLRHEYRLGLHADFLDENECWAEGERLRAAIENFRTNLLGQLN